MHRADTIISAVTTATNQQQYKRRFSSKYVCTASLLLTCRLPGWASIAQILNTFRLIPTRIELGGYSTRSRHVRFSPFSTLIPASNYAERYDDLTVATTGWHPRCSTTLGFKMVPGYIFVVSAAVRRKYTSYVDIALMDVSVYYL